MKFNSDNLSGLCIALMPHQLQIILCLSEFTKLQYFYHYSVLKCDNRLFAKLSVFRVHLVASECTRFSIFACWSHHKSCERKRFHDNLHSRSSRLHI